MRHVTCFSVVAVAVVVLAGCRDNSLQPPPQLSAAIQDGNHAGNPNFFFLPPLVTSPLGSPNYDPGKFNAHLAPVAEVCELAANPIFVPTTDCKAGPLVFGPAPMALDLINQQYQLNWDTQASALILTSFYRITVRGSARGTALGFLDVDPVLGGVKNLTTGDVVQFQNGRTLPIKVRIEQGAFGGGSNTDDFVEQVVPNVIPSGTLDVTTNTKHAGARITSGWLSFVNGLSLDQVVVIIERVPITDGVSCLNTTLEQQEGCYRFRTDPDLHTLLPRTDLRFGADVIAGVCFQYPGDIDNLNGGRPFSLYRSEETSEGVATALELVEREAPFLDCSEFGPTPPPPPSIGAAFRSGRFGDIAKAGLYALTHAIGRVIQPEALHAVDLGAGGSTDGFSFFGYARHAMLTATVSAATAPAGSTVQATAMIGNSHHGVPSTPGPQPVTFTVISGGGTLSASENDVTICSETRTCTVTTNDGSASVSWRLGVGENHVQVSTPYVTNSPQTIDATGLGADLVVSDLTHSPASPTDADLIDFGATITNIGNVPAGAFTLVVQTGGESVSLDGLAPGTSELAPGQSVTRCCWRAHRAAGSYTQTATADFTNVIPEANESNNTRTDSYDVRAVVYTGRVTDPTGDAPAGEPDLVSAVATVALSSLTLRVDFAPGTRASTTEAVFYLDVDQNPGTGASGIRGGGGVDGDIIGPEYLVTMEENAGPNLRILHYEGGSFVEVLSSIPVTFSADAMQATIPLDLLLFEKDGILNYKVNIDRELPSGGFTSVLDDMPNIGLPAGTVAP